MRRVVSLWLPRFATDRLSRRQPAWRTEPLATVHKSTAGGGHVMRIAAVNRAAEAAAGIMPGLALGDARARLPDLRVVPATPEADRAALAALADWCGRWTPWTAPDETAGAAHHAIWLDVTGCAHLFGGEAALVEALVARLQRFGFAAHAALAETPGAAWALSHHGGKRRVRVVKRGGLRAALARLPVAGLRLDAAEAAGLERLGLDCIGALDKLPRGALARRFGPAVVRRLDQALGRAPEPLSPQRAASPDRVQLAFAEPIASSDAVAAGTRRLLARLVARLAEGERGARRLVLALYRVDGTVARLEVGTSAPMRDAAHLMTLLAERLDTLDAGFGIEIMTLDAPLSEPLAPDQPALASFARAAAGHDVARLVDRLGNRFGAASVYRLGARESHVPERAQAAVGPLAPSGAWPRTGRRPLRLLSRPEPVEVVALVPDEPPVMFRWRRVVHRVVKADGPERIAAEWWRAADARDAIRDYYRVEDAEGRRFWLYRDAPYRPGMAPGWWLHGIFA